MSRVWKMNRKTARRLANRRSMIEPLESRMMMSAAAVPGDFYPDYVDLTKAGAVPNQLVTTVTGFIPSQIRSAYGFNSVSFGGGSIAANGAGQTIALIDAYNDPNIVSDLNFFDTHFGIPAPPSFKVVNQTGGSILPATDVFWSGEISLDVEWAHAIAPAANLLLVEANSTASISPSGGTGDLFQAVEYARSVPSVSVVSMSFGGSEFFAEPEFGETETELSLDSIFTTPAGHQGITFLASAGDSGTISGVQYPAASPNVVSVGGTSLYVNTNNTYNSELGWSGTNGGVSLIEPAGSYQTVAQAGLNTEGMRSVPDVSYIADPATGVAVYDTVPADGVSGWQDVGGTSNSCPEWGALIAIADQGRNLAGLGTLDGPTKTLPMLYSLYSAPGTAGYANYLNYFHDVTSGGNGTYRFAWSGEAGNGITAAAGYDEITGLGSPHAANIINFLASDTATVVSDNSGDGVLGNGNVDTSPSSTYPVGLAFLLGPTATVHGGDAGKLKFQITDTQNITFSGAVTITVYVSTDDTISTDDTVAATLSLPSVTIRPTKFKNETIKFNYPTNLSTGSYYVLAQVEQTSSTVLPGIAVPTTPVTIIAPVLDLSTAFTPTTAVLVREGKRAAVAIDIENLGNVTAVGTINLSLYASSDGLIDAASNLLASLPNHRIKVAPGKSIVVHLAFNALASELGGTYSLIAQTTATTTPVEDSNTADNTATVATRAS